MQSTKFIGYCDRCGYVTEELTDVLVLGGFRGQVVEAPWCDQCVLEHAEEVDGYGSALADRVIVRECEGCHTWDGFQRVEDGPALCRSCGL